MRWEPFVVALLLAAGVSGCVEETGPRSTLPATPEPRRGSIVGVAVDEERLPVSNVSITVDDVPAATTDAGGSFVLRDLVEGRHVLAAAHPEYEPFAKETIVLGELEVDVEVVLVKLPAFRPYNFTLPAMRGHYDCAAEYVIITGDCGILYENITCTVSTCQSDPVTTEKYEFEFDVPARWDTIVGELVWEESNTNLVEGMRLYLENANVSAQGGHGKKAARVDGSENPLSLRYERGVAYPGAENYEGTSTPAFVPAEGGREQFRVFPLGNGWETTRTFCSGGRCLLGVGAAVDLSFTLYVTIFVNEPAPAGFSYVATLPK
ncbi:MAG: carboxypeptidase regulatory-like domain-containing protein [Euryarchaeota archaeon]|nr:carboxypeptidase regulatory-like domain-containing protein [Euryarchaeota archaeon]